MGYAKLNPMYEYVKGAVSKPKKVDGHSHGTYQIMTHRESPTTNPNCQRVYVKPADAYARTTPVKSTEIQARSRFAAVAALVNTRKSDVSKIASDQAAFLAQKDTPGGKKTMKAYLWMICGDQYDQG